MSSVRLKHACDVFCGKPVEAVDQLALAARILLESENRTEWFGAARIAWDEQLREHRNEIERIEHRIRAGN